MTDTIKIVRVTDPAATRVVRVTDPAQSRVVRVSVPGPQGPPGNPILENVRRLAHVHVDACEQGEIQIFQPNRGEDVDGLLISGDTIIIAAVVQVTLASAVVTPPALSIGTNATDYDDIMVATDLIGATTEGQTWHIPVTGIARMLIAGDIVYCRVVTGATAAEMLLEVHLFGVQIG